LVFFLVVASLLAVLAIGLSKSRVRETASGVSVVVGGLWVSAIGFAIAGLAGLPVWMWAGRVADGSETLGSMASRSEGLASLSQTVLLMIGLGGLLVAMSVLGVVAVVSG
jgi:hypothetical protein